MSEPAECEIANYLLPDGLRSEDYWNKNILSIDAIQMVSAILFKQVHNFKKQQNRETGFLLIVVSGMAWQQIRSLSDKFKKDNGKVKPDKEVLNDYCGWFEDDYQFPLYEDHKKVFENISFIYQLCSTIRHPEQEDMKKYNFIFSFDWPKEKNEEILSGCKSILDIHQIFCHEFSPNSGWEYDVKEKTSLYNNAKT